MKSFEIGGQATGVTRMSELFATEADTQFEQLAADAWAEKVPAGKDYAHQLQVARNMARLGISCPKEYEYYCTI